MGSLDIFDLIIILSGIYLIYSAYMMKQKGTVSTALIGKGYDLNIAKDIPGFIQVMYKKSLILGIVTVTVGILDYCNEKYFGIAYLSLVLSALYLIIIFVYGKFSLDAQKKYLASK